MRCAAAGCGANDKTNPTLKFFRFPANPVRYKKWCSVVGINDDLHLIRYLCERHFGPDQFRYRGLVYMEDARYPTGPLNAIYGNYAPDHSASRASKNDDVQAKSIKQDEILSKGALNNGQSNNTKETIILSKGAVGNEGVQANSSKQVLILSNVAVNKEEAQVKSIKQTAILSKRGLNKGEAQAKSIKQPVILLKGAGDNEVALEKSVKRPAILSKGVVNNDRAQAKSIKRPVILSKVAVSKEEAQIKSITPAVILSKGAIDVVEAPVKSIAQTEILTEGDAEVDKPNIREESESDDEDRTLSICEESSSDIEVSPADIYEVSVNDFEDRTLNICEKSLSDVVHETETILEESLIETVTLETPSYAEPSLREVAEARKTRGEEPLDVPCQEITDILLKDKEEDNENNNMLQSEPPIPKPHFIKVLGQQNFQDPSVIKSVLDKVKLKKKGSVFVLPVKKNCNLTREKLEKIIEELPSENIDVKQRLLTLVRGKSSVGQNKLISKVKKASQQRRIRKNSLSNSVRKRVRGGKTKVSPALKVRIGASSSRGNLQQSLDRESFTDFTNIFTATTILTDINDKSQIEQLCQLMIKSLFTVKNLNVNGTMSKIEIYLMQSSEISIEENLDNNKKQCEEGLENNEASREKKKQNEVAEAIENASIITEPLAEISECVEIPFVDTSVCTKSVPQSEETPLHGKTNMAAFHDHAYLPGERKSFFEKPPYLINLINIDRDKPKKNLKILNVRPKTISKKHQRQFLKQRRHIARLKDFLKKKTDYVENIKCKVKYLRLVLCKKFGVKHVRYPQLNKAQVDGENHPHDVNEHGLGENDENAQSEIDTAVLNIYSTSKLGKREKKPKRKSEKDKIILTPDFVVPPARKRRRKKSLLEVVETNIETSEVDFDTRFNLFHRSLINE